MIQYSSVPNLYPNKKQGKVEEISDLARSYISKTKTAFFSILNKFQTFSPMVVTSLIRSCCGLLWQRYYFSRAIE